MSTLRDCDGTVLFDIKRKIAKWNEYVENLFSDQRPEPILIAPSDGVDFSSKEIIDAIKKIENR